MGEVITMTVETSTLVPMTEANQNFSKVTRLVDESGLAVILKNNKPRYIVVNFEEYDALQAARAARRQKVEAAADQLIEENLDALRELAK
jgi:antitoxin Phd